MAIVRARKRQQAIKGRADQGVGANKTGVYQTTEVERDQDGNVVKQTLHTIYRLRRITDGFCIDKALGRTSKEGTPDSDRQALQKLLTKTIAVYEDGEEKILPLVFLDEPLRGEQARLGRVGPFTVPTADDTVRRTMAELCEQREERIRGSARNWNKQRDEAEVADVAAREVVSARNKKQGAKA